MNWLAVLINIVTVYCDASTRQDDPILSQLLKKGTECVRKYFDIHTLMSLKLTKFGSQKKMISKRNSMDMYGESKRNPWEVP